MTEIPLTGLNPPHFCACFTQGPGIPMPYVVNLFVFSGLRGACLLVEYSWPSLFKLPFHNTVKPANTVTSIKQSPVFKGEIVLVLS
jgi:hypothetical protein